MQFILPRAEWDNDALRAALVQILRRLDKVFLKISKKPSIRVSQANQAVSLTFIELYFYFFFISEIRIGKQHLVY